MTKVDFKSKQDITTISLPFLSSAYFFFYWGSKIIMCPVGEQCLHATYTDQST